MTRRLKRRDRCLLAWLLDVRKWHFSEVVVPMRDVRSWGKTGSGQRWGEPTRLTLSGHASEGGNWLTCPVLIPDISGTLRTPFRAVAVNVRKPYGQMFTTTRHQA